MNKRIALLALFLGACASSSGVSKTGADTFTITTSASPGKGGVPAAKRMAYEEAAAECSKRSSTVIVDSEQLNAPTWTEGMAIASLNFHCGR